LKRSERKELKNGLRDQSQMLLGQIIAKLRKKADITQEDLAYECGIDRSFMSKLERGETSISLITLILLAKGLGTKPSAILKRLETELSKLNLEETPQDQY